MLDIYFGYNDAAVELREVVTVCNSCDQEAFIFQEEGNFCLQCWQERTEPSITVRDNPESSRLVPADVTGQLNVSPRDIQDNSFLKRQWIFKSWFCEVCG
jgi:predicted secreted protein